MNMQAMIKQAQKLQKDMMEEKKTIDEKLFEAENEMVSIKMKGTKHVVELKIKLDTIDVEDKEILEDMILVATNQVISKIEEETNEKMGKYTQGMSGMM